MEYKTKGIYPEDALRYFEDLTRIPHGSGNEAGIAQYLLDFAKEHGLWAKTDDIHNVYMKKPGSKGMEELPAVLLQGHTDMVCAKTEDSAHDFEKDPLTLIVDNGLLHADRTTLGADNGVAVALMLAMLARDDFPHPPIECLFTTQEETGLCGAQAADLSCFSANRLINLDGGPEGMVVAGSAGGLRMDFDLSPAYEPASGKILEIKVCGLLGGHSGTMIDKEHGNANKLMGRVLHGLPCAWNLVTLSGGSKDNAIPQECTAVIALPEADAGAAVSAVQKLEADFQTELQGSDPGVCVRISPVEADRMMSRADSDTMMKLLFLLPCGVMTRNLALNAVTTSMNVGTIATNADGIHLVCSLRSSSATELAYLADRLRMLGALLGLRVSDGAGYPAWGYTPVSPLRDLCAEVYQEQTGKELQMAAIHGGLECGLFKEKRPELDIVSMGPEADGAHTPDETLDLTSFGRFYDFLKGVLVRLTEK